MERVCGTGGFVDFGGRSFATAILMNDLPKVLCVSGSRNTFIKHLKIFSFHRNFVMARRVCDNRLTRRLYELNYLFYSLKLTGP